MWIRHLPFAQNLAVRTAVGSDWLPRLTCWCQGTGVDNAQTRWLWLEELQACKCVIINKYCCNTKWANQYAIILQTIILEFKPASLTWYVSNWKFRWSCCTSMTWWCWQVLPARSCTPAFQRAHCVCPRCHWQWCWNHNNLQSNACQFWQKSIFWVVYYEV